MSQTPKQHAPTAKERQIEEQRLDLQRKAREALKNARSETHIGMNRMRRRKIAKANHVFKYRGLWQGIFGESERQKLEAKTYKAKNDST